MGPCVPAWGGGAGLAACVARWWVLGAGGVAGSARSASVGAASVRVLLVVLWRLGHDYFLFYCISPLFLPSLPAFSSRITRPGILFRLASGRASRWVRRRAMGPSLKRRSAQSSSFLIKSGSLCEPTPGDNIIYTWKQIVLRMIIDHRLRLMIYTQTMIYTRQLISSRQREGPCQGRYKPASKVSGRMPSVDVKGLRTLFPNRHASSQLNPSLPLVTPISVPTTGRPQQPPPFSSPLPSPPGPFLSSGRYNAHGSLSLLCRGALLERISQPRPLLLHNRLRRCSVLQLSDDLLVLLARPAASNKRNHTNRELSDRGRDRSRFTAPCPMRPTTALRLPAWRRCESSACLACQWHCN